MGFICNNFMRFRSLFISALFMPLVGCGVLQTISADMSQFDAEGSVSEKDSESEYFDLLVGKFALMALLAETVYRDDLLKAEHMDRACSEELGAEEMAYGIPQNHNGTQGAITASGWRRVKNSEIGEDVACVNSKGLYYETFLYNSREGGTEEAVIAFRGTENRKGQYFYDWRSNISGFFGFEPPQYRDARNRLPILIGYLRELNPKIKISATGHSLGGGLAQQAGYLSRHVNEVFTFNSTPVTNWTSLRLNKLVDNEFPVIYRFYHGGEVLEKVRYVVTSFTKTRYGRYDMGMQKTTRSRGVEGHSMKIIACSLIHRSVENSSITYRHNFNQEMARAVLDGNSPCAPSPE